VTRKSFFSKELVGKIFLPLRGKKFSKWRFCGCLEGYFVYLWLGLGGRDQEGVGNWER
jgi:hypothetical protein